MDIEGSRMQLELSLDRLEVRDGPLDATWSKYTAMLVPGLAWADQAELDASLKDGKQPPACACVSAHSTLDDLLRVAPCGSCRQRTRFTYVALQKALTRIDHRLQSAQTTTLHLPLETLDHQRTLLSGKLDRYETLRSGCLMPADQAAARCHIALRLVFDEAGYGQLVNGVHVKQIQANDENYGEACLYTAGKLQEMINRIDAGILRLHHMCLSPI